MWAVYAARFNLLHVLPMAAHTWFSLCMHACTHIEVRVSCLHLLCSFLFLRQGLLLILELTDSARLAAQRTPGTALSPPLSQLCSSRCLLAFPRCCGSKLSSSYSHSEQLTHRVVPLVSPHTWLVWGIQGVPFSHLYCVSESRCSISCLLEKKSCVAYDVGWFFIMAA